MFRSLFQFDVNQLATTATRQNGDFVLTGSKCYVPLGAEAQHLLVYARGEQGPTAFIVPRGTTGLSVAGREQNMGLKALATYELTLDGCRVPASALLRGDLTPLLNRSRVALAALAVGVARAALEYARDYAKERRAFGVFIAQKQAIAFMLCRNGVRDRRHAAAHVGGGVEDRSRVVAGCVIACGCSMQGPSAETEKNVTPAGLVTDAGLRIITEDLPPFNYAGADGKATGQATEVVNSILIRLNQKAAIEILPWSEGYTLVRTGPRVALYSTGRTDERENLFKWVARLRALNTPSMPGMVPACRLTGSKRQKRAGVLA